MNMKAAVATDNPSFKAPTSTPQSGCTHISKWVGRIVVVGGFVVIGASVFTLLAGTRSLGNLGDKIGFIATLGHHSTLTISLSSVGIGGGVVACVGGIFY